MKGQVRNVRRPIVMENQERFPKEEGKEGELLVLQGIENDFERAATLLAAGGDAEDLKRLEFLGVGDAITRTLDLIDPVARESQASVGAIVRMLSRLARTHQWKEYDDIDYSQVRAMLQRRGFRLNPEKTAHDLAA